MTAFAQLEYGIPVEDFMLLSGPVGCGKSVVVGAVCSRWIPTTTAPSTCAETTSPRWSCTKTSSVPWTMSLPTYQGPRKDCSIASSPNSLNSRWFSSTMHRR